MTNDQWPSPQSIGGKNGNHIVCVCPFAILGKLQTLTTQMSYWQTFAKPFRYKVMTIYITHSYCFQTWDDSWGQLDTSKHTVSWLSLVKHYIKSNTTEVFLATALNSGSKHSCQEMSNDVHVYIIQNYYNLLCIK